jgi:hypothetical protein
VQRVTDEVHLDITHYAQAIFQHPRSLRVDPWVGSYLCENPILLYETQHWFEFTQASVFAQFYRAENVLERARPLAESARQEWMTLHTGLNPDGPEWVWTYLSILQNAGNAIACLSGPPLPERRFMLHLPQRAQAVGRPGLASGLADLFYPTSQSAENWQSWLEDWKSALTGIAALSSCPEQLKPCRHAYYLRAGAALVADHPEAAAWNLLRTWTLAQTIAPQESAPQAWQAVVQALELDPVHHAERLEALDGYLDGLEETLDEWAQQNGI